MGRTHGARLAYFTQKHRTVSVGKLQSWLNGGGKSPNQQVAKSRPETYAEVIESGSFLCAHRVAFQKASDS